MSQLFEHSQSPVDLECDTVVFAVSHTESGPRLLPSSLSAERSEELAKVLPLLGFEGKTDQVCVSGAAGRLRAKTLTFVGIGEASPTDPNAIRRAAGCVTRTTKSSSIAFDWDLRDESLWQALAEGAGFGAYRFDQYKTSSSSNVEKIYLADTAAAKAGVEKATVIIEAAKLLRDLVNTPPLDLYPESFAKHAENAIKGLPLEIEIWDAEKLEEEGCGGIVGVGRGSHRQPLMVKISYQPADAKSHVAFIGKGITFDTGGISLKTPLHMENMKSDMTGAATVLAATIAAARYNLPVQVTTFLALAENMPGGNAQRPADIVKIRNGKTVEVINTDAEGRMVMADALSLACELDPDSVIDVATLTGAQIVALGTRTAGIMGQGNVPQEIFQASKEAGEEMWVMPIPEETKQANASKFADVKNSGGRSGGMLVAAQFLSNFVGDTPWAHIDIAGPSYNTDGDWGYTCYGATAMSLRTLVRYLSQVD
ncbi:leucyl aminopeptidase [Actinomycetaceae bacterium TAE3-ERU4]|nr:leucyl aminopeptidase [Actinomycetaceae bacterium TAE3-ERU4]